MQKKSTQKQGEGKSNISEWYVADFETKSEKFYKENGYTEVWLYAICDSDANIVNYGSNIDDFMSYIKHLRGKIVYFHNLKFDGNFIVSWLLRNGFEYNDNLRKNDARGFSTLISDTGIWYSIRINFGKNVSVDIHDSLKVLPFKVEKMAKDFGLPILKEKIDYDDYTIDDKRLEYVFHDVKIVAMCLKKIKEEGINKMTTASSAYHNYVDMMGGSERVLRIFPTLDEDFMLDYREAYRGGRSQVNPRYANKKLTNIKRFDINSMYPWVMHDCLLPYGRPIKCTKPNQYAFELYKVAIEFHLKKNCLPSLLKKSCMFGLYGDSYYKETEGVEILYISNIDLELVKRNYVITYLEYMEIYGFFTTATLFKKYVDYWYTKKQHDKGAPRIADKLALNSLYGKFGSNFQGRHKMPSLNNDVVIFGNSEYEEMTKYYLPIAIAVTSYAHKKLDDGIHATGIDKFVYCDTDSIHTLGDLPKEWVDNTELGKYKLEAVEEQGKYIRQKCYVSKDNGKWSITCAGMPQNIKDKLIEDYGDKLPSIFKVGLKAEGKLLPKIVKGGVILHGTTFEIK